MSYHKSVWIYCDGKDCPLSGEAGTDLENGSAAEARGILKARGWINRGALDFCPECAAADAGRKE